MSTSVPLHRMANGVMDWTNLKNINKIRKHYAQSNSIQYIQDRQKTLKLVPCIQFIYGNVQGKTIINGKIYSYVTFGSSVFIYTRKIGKNHPKRDC